VAGTRHFVRLVQCLPRAFRIMLLCVSIPIHGCVSTSRLSVSPWNCCHACDVCLHCCCVVSAPLMPRVLSRHRYPRAMTCATEAMSVALSGALSAVCGLSWLRCLGVSVPDTDFSRLDLLRKD
jgi:hypothetical protein